MRTAHSLPNTMLNQRNKRKCTLLLNYSTSVFRGEPEGMFEALCPQGSFSVMHFLIGDAQWRHVWKRLAVRSVRR